MIDFYEAHLSPPCTAPSLSHPIITVLMTYLFVFQGMTFLISLFLSLSSALKERGARRSLKAAGSVGCSMTYKPIQRDKLHDTSAGRLVTFWYGVGFSHAVFVLLLIAGCYRLTVRRSALWSVISNQCLANDTLGLLLTRLARNCCWLKTGLWLEIWADQYGSPQRKKYGNVLNSAARLWIRV